MTREEQTAQWRTVVDQQAASRLSAAAFCREHGISLQRFYVFFPFMKTHLFLQGLSVNMQLIGLVVKLSPTKYTVMNVKGDLLQHDVWPFRLDFALQRTLQLCLLPNVHP